MTENFKKELVAFIIGVLIGGFFVNGLIHDSHDYYSLDGEEGYHIHTDFLIQTRETVHDLGTAELMSTAEHQLSHDVHLHDDNGDVLHMHAENVSFVDFLQSIHIDLNQDCLIINDEDYCQTGDETLTLFVNEEIWQQDFANYIPQDLDRVLVYYGNLADSPIQNYLDAIPDESCIYSGSCPDRGVAPPESCGLTCEL